MRQRLSYFVLLGLAVFLLPWWISGGLFVWLAWRINNFYESLGWAFCFDLVFSTPVNRLANFAFPATLLAIIILIILNFLKHSTPFQS